MRLFTAIDLPPAILDGLDRLISQLRPAAPRLRWSPAANLHITTKFIGEWSAGGLEGLKSALAALPSRPLIPIAVRGLGWFPNPHSPRVFWAAVHGGERLAALARDTEAALAGLGIPREDRPFSPHLTLARVKTEPVGALRQAVAALPNTGWGEFTAASFHLYLSERGPGGSVYTSLAEFPLERP